MRHFTEEEMIAYEMQESEQSEAVCEHLQVCPECAAVDAEIAETLREFRDEPVPALEFERSWERVREHLRPAAVVTLGQETAAEMGIFASLWQGLREALFPEKLPPLKLQSKPVPVVDRMAVQRDPKSAAISFAIHAVAILLIGYIVANGMVRVMAPPVKVITMEVPPPTPPKKDLMSNGGGGQRGPLPVSKGEVPKIMAPPTPKIEQPKIVQPPTIDLDMKMASTTMPNLGDPRSPLVGTSMGSGAGGGIGSGTGGGLGSGLGGNTGGGFKHVGGGISAPVVLRPVEPEFSEEARRAKFQGNVLVYLVVDAKGRPQNVRVAKPVGMGLDEKAVEAIKQYLFKPAMEGGKPVAVELTIEVSFNIY